jgi:hypothetical protein
MLHGNPGVGDDFGVELHLCEAKPMTHRAMEIKEA